ncbi:MAG: restriction endonuclease subunit S [Ruminococcus sp.]|nr:restriction endonuclease subunit S [Ruminococcus sp.]
MSELQRLINKLCPDGVEYKKLADVAEISTGLSNTNDAIENGIYPFYVRSQEPLKKNDYEYDEEAVITAGDGVGVGKVFHYINGKYALHQRAYRIHITFDELSGKYLYYYFISKFPEYIKSQLFQGSVPSIRRPMLNKFKIPVPPMPVQREIVHILDNFTELTQELMLRKKQYEYYRDMLLNFDDNVQLRTLGEVCIFFNGDRGKNYPSVNEYVVDGIPFINAGDIKNGVIDLKKCNKITEEKYNNMGGAKLQNGDIIYCLRGSIGKNGIFNGESGTLASSLVAIRTQSKDIINKYIYYLLNSNMELKQRLTKDNGAAQPNLSAQSVKNYKFPIPPIEEQERIVKILDRFDRLCNDLTDGLPAEINARQKQYEYYRDKLLMFKVIK